jgi:hypothetical protein
MMKQHAINLQPQLFLNFIIQLSVNDIFPTTHVLTNPTHSHKTKGKKTSLQQ